MPVDARVLPAAVALSLLGMLTAGGIAASGLRADERRAEAEGQRVAAARALAEAEAGYRTALAGLAEEVFDQVQPLQRSADAVDDSADGSFTVLSDVISNGGSVEALTRVRTQLPTLSPPPTYADAHRALDSSLQLLVGGAQALRDSVVPDLDEQTFFRTFDRGNNELDGGVRILTAQLESVFARGGMPSVPTQTGEATGRRPAGKPAYLVDVGALCAPTLPDEDDRPEGLRRAAAAVRDLLRAVAAVPAPAADAELVRTTITDHVERASVFADALEAIAGGIERGDPREVARGELQLERGAREIEQAAKGFKAYGSQTCERAFGSGEEQEPERPA